MLPDLNTTSTDLSPGRPRRSGPMRQLVRLVGPIATPIAGTRVFPLWGILRHTGRTSGKPYATPIVALPTPDGFIIPLPFGDATQWAKNLFAASGGSIRHAGREHRIAERRRSSTAWRRHPICPGSCGSWPGVSGSAIGFWSGGCRASRSPLGVDCIRPLHPAGAYSMLHLFDGRQWRGP